MFDSIATLAVASNMRELYRLVLVDTPLAPYFSESLSAGLLLPQHFPLPLTFGHGLQWRLSTILYSYLRECT